MQWCRAVVIELYITLWSFQVVPIFFEHYIYIYIIYYIVYNKCYNIRSVHIGILHPTDVRQRSPH